MADDQPEWDLSQAGNGPTNDEHTDVALAGCAMAKLSAVLDLMKRIEDDAMIDCLRVLLTDIYYEFIDAGIFPDLRPLEQRKRVQGGR